MAEVDKLIPDLRGLVDQQAEQRIHDAFNRVYEFFERKLSIAQQENNKLLQQQASDFRKTSDLVNGIFATPLIGSTSAPNPLQSIGVGNGTVTSISSNSASSGFALTGGPITQTGTITFSISSAANARTTLGIDDIATKKSNLTAIVAPGVGNDSSQGYAVGSFWIDTVLNDIYQAANVAVGAAVWRKLN